MGEAGNCLAAVTELEGQDPHPGPWPPQVGAGLSVSGCGVGVHAPHQAAVVISPWLGGLKMACCYSHMTFINTAKGDLIMHIICHHAQNEPKRFLREMNDSRSGPR